ncbi:MAG: M3 family oligoendopeptidase [Candidatus Sumerlaeia bacterium]
MGAELKIQAVRGEEFPRDYTRGVTDFGDWGQLEPLLAGLADQVAAIQTAEELGQWLLRESELDSAIDEEYTRRYIAMTCATDDKEREQVYLHFLENILPRLKPWHDKLARLYLACPARQRLERSRAEVMDRRLQNEVELYRDENVPIETEVAKLGQQYQKIMGAMTVNWRGQERTLQQMAPFLEELDRPVREEAWRAIAERRLADRVQLEKLFDHMVKLRTRIAANAGFKNFRDYQHRAMGRFDYTPADAIRFQESIEAEVVPLLAREREKRRKQLDVPTLRPWDLDVDPEGAPPLKPFSTADELMAGCDEIFRRVSPDLADQFGDMRRRGLLDLDSRIGKAPGGYQSTLDEVRLPFIFMNAAGTQRDVFTLLHEGGHAFHAYASRTDPWLAYRSAPLEFSEVASMSMELFSAGHMDVFFKNSEDAKRARRKHIQDIVRIFPWIATVDAFQHWIYLNPGSDPAMRDAKFLELERRFSPGVDWSGLDREHDTAWHRQLHIFEVPFYYIEYGIAQLGALQLWVRFMDDPRGAIEGYRRALALGGSRPLPELFAAAGIRFDFSPDTLRPAIQAVSRELEKLE